MSREVRRLFCDQIGQFTLIQGNVARRAVVAENFGCMQTGHGSKDAEMSGAFHGIKMKRRIGGVPRHCLQGVQIAWALRPFEHKNRIVKITRP